MYLKYNRNLLKLLKYYNIKRNISSIKSSKEIRNEFLNYFINDNQHTFIRSSSIVPYCDPTVAFVNAGMNQFKNIFLGTTLPSCKRAANSQKCVRVGGKHNDLSAVGLDGYHHTFFEMLGNWSFGDYFKEEACRLAWNLLTGPYQINPNRLYVTYFAGDEKLNLPPDYECKEIWLSFGISSDRILPFGVNDNFWEMGTTGPCGPCTEIHIDHLPNSNPNLRAKFVNADSPDLTELWNIVFIEYNRQANGLITNLPQKHIDTGMGMERLTAILQNKTNNYDTDLFTPLFDVIEKVNKVQKYEGKFTTDATLDIAYRTLADHTRMVTTCIADGMFPDENHKLRRILRRALLLSERTFNNNNLLYELIPVVVNILGDTYKELNKNYKQIIEIVKHEDEIYKLLRDSKKHEISILLNKYKYLDEMDLYDSAGFIDGFKEIKKLKENKNTDLIQLDGNFLFKLYDTYGINVENIEKLCAIENVPFDRDSLEEALLRHKNKTKNLLTLKQLQSDYNNISSNSSGNYEIFDESHLINIANILKTVNINKTNNIYKYNYKYDELNEKFLIDKLETKILLIIKDKEVISQVNKENTSSNNLIHIITEKSNFYYESGGQSNDYGELMIINNDNEETKISVNFINNINNYIIHSGYLMNGKLNNNDNCLLVVNNENRTGNIRHHTATHLLNSTIDYLLKLPSYQKSSQVTKNSLKLEINIYGKHILDKTVLKEIELMVKKLIKNKNVMNKKLITINDLYKYEKLKIIPGEIYPENDLRLIEFYDKLLNFNSCELCCGTHVHNTSELIDFCIINFKILGRGKYLFNAIAGDAAVQAHQIGSEVYEDVLTIKNDVDNGKQTIDDLESRIQRLKTMLQHGFDVNVNIPYIIKLECLEILNNIHKQIKDASKDNLRELIEIEMKNLLEEKSIKKYPFIVHFLTVSAVMEDIQLQKATRYCTNRPIIILSLTDGIVKARCCIPQNFINENFTADKWLLNVSKIFNGKMQPPKGQNINEICNMKGKKVNTTLFEEQLENALAEAHKYARKFM